MVLDQAVGRPLLHSPRFDFQKNLILILALTDPGLGVLLIDFLLLNSHSYFCTYAGHQPTAGKQPQPTPLQADLSTLPILTDKGGKPLHIFTIVSESDLD